MDLTYALHHHHSQHYNIINVKLSGLVMVQAHQFSLTFKFTDQLANQNVFIMLLVPT